MEYGSENTPARWWTQKRQVHEGVWSVARRIEQEQSSRRLFLKKYQELYEDSWHGQATDGRHVVSYNMVRSCIDTVCSKISKNKPRIQVLTSGGNYSLKKKAKQLTKFLSGQFQEMNLHHKAQLVFRDACIFDGGALRIFREPDSERIKCERVYPHEILIDSFESYYGEPRQMFLKRAAHRDVLTALYPKKRGYIEVAPAAKLDVLSGGRESNSLIDVIESWHLPSAEGATDGRHVICIEGATLFDEPYTHAEFPFVFFRWQDPVKGFWMPGLAQELWGLQAELNTHLENIRVAHRRMGRPVVWISNGAKIDDVDMNNEIGAVIRGDEPPVFQQTPVMHPQVYAWTEKLKSFGYEMPGISQAASAGKKPDGLESGVAIREVNDIETERFILAGQRYERIFHEAAQKIIRLARDMYADGVDLTIKGRDRKFLESIKWSDVDMDDDTYELDMFETSGLPNQPAGRIQTVIDLASNGIVKPEIAADLIGFPDIESAMEMERAPRELIEKTLDSMADGGDYIAPEPQWDLALAKARGVLKLNWCKVEGVGEEEQEMIRTFIADCEDLLTAAAPPPVPPAMPPAPEMPLPPMPGTEIPLPMDPSSMVASMPEMGGAPMPPPIV
jgi:hypothetical protein